MLVEYNAAVPNGAERIMTMAEKQQTHRHQMEGRVIRAIRAGGFDGRASTQKSDLPFISSLVSNLSGECPAEDVPADVIRYFTGVGCRGQLRVGDVAGCFEFVRDLTQALFLRSSACFLRP